MPKESKRAGDTTTCEKCGSQGRVIDMRHTRNYVRRRRRCTKCGETWTSVEFRFSIKAPLGTHDSSLLVVRDRDIRRIEAAFESIEALRESLMPDELSEKLGYTP